MKKILTIITTLCVLSFFSLSADCRAESAIRYFTQGKDVKGSDTPYGNNISIGKYAQTEDAKIYYEVYGKGTPVFIFHGGGVGTPYEMGEIIDKLRNDYQVAVVSTRGHGRSEIGSSPLTYEQKATDMAAVMGQVTSKPAVIIGFSDGAYAAYKVAAMFPEKVERIVAIGAGTVEKGFFKGDLLVSELEKIDPDFVAQQRSIMPELKRWQEFCSNYMKFWGSMEVGKNPLSYIKCPVLLIAGDEDDHAPIATMLNAHQLIPNSRLCIVPKAWHTAFLDNFDVTWTAINQFLSTKHQDLLPSKKVEYNSRYK